MLTVYPDEYYNLCKSIRRRQLQEQLDAYDRELFPHRDEEQRKALIDATLAQLRHFDNMPERPARLDRGALMAFKKRLRNSKAVAVK